MTHPDLLRWKATLDTLDYVAEGRNISISNPPCYERLENSFGIPYDYDYSPLYKKHTCSECEYIGIKRTLGVFIYGYFCTIKGPDRKTSNIDKNNKACHRFDLEK